MGDQHGGAPLHGLLDGAEYLLLGVRVDAGRGIVQEQNRRFQEHGAGNGQALPLPAREVAPFFVEPGVVAVRQGANEFVGGRNARRPADLLARGRGMAEGDVVGDCAAEQERFLEDHADRARRSSSGERADIHAVDEHTASGRVEKARDQVQERAFAGSRSAQNRHALTRPYMQIDIFEHRIAGLIVEADTLAGDFAARTA